MLFWVPHCSLSSIRKKKKKEISCSNSFFGLICQVLRTQRSSVSITLSAFKQNEQKVALRRWVFLSRTQPTIHPACTCVEKCPADPYRCHFVNSPHCFSLSTSSVLFIILLVFFLEQINKQTKPHFHGASQLHLPQTPFVLPPVYDFISLHNKLSKCIINSPWDTPKACCGATNKVLKHGPYPNCRSHLQWTLRLIIILCFTLCSD